MRLDNFYRNISIIDLLNVLLYFNLIVLNLIYFISDIMYRVFSVKRHLLSLGVIIRLLHASKLRRAESEVPMCRAMYFT